MMMRFRNFFARSAVLVFAVAALPSLAQEAPDALVKRVSRDVLQTIKTDPKVQAGDQQRIREVVETKLLPHFDFERITALAMGRNWRQATPEQQKQLVDQFRTLLVRTYSGALTQYRDQTMDYKPLRADPAATDVTVRTEVIRPGQAPVQIDYGMTKTAAGWKVYDVIVGGVSLVTNYRDEFNEQIKSGGVDGLIKTLTDKNQGNAGQVMIDRAHAATGGRIRRRRRALDLRRHADVRRRDGGARRVARRCRCRPPASSTCPASRTPTPRRSRCCSRCAARGRRRLRAAVRSDSARRSIRSRASTASRNCWRVDRIVAATGTASAALQPSRQPIPDMLPST